MASSCSRQANSPPAALKRKKSVTAGLRAEDCQVTLPSEGKIEAKVYAVELMGDHTLVTCKVGDATVTVKADKSAHYEMDKSIGINFALPSVFLFDAETGVRIRTKINVNSAQTGWLLSGPGFRETDDLVGKQATMVRRLVLLVTGAHEHKSGIRSTERDAVG